MAAASDMHILRARRFRRGIRFKAIPRHAADLAQCRFWPRRAGAGMSAGSGCRTSSRRGGVSPIGDDCASASRRAPACGDHARVCSVCAHLTADSQ